jgi:methionyl aminopeptidase
MIIKDQNTYDWYQQASKISTDILWELSRFLKVGIYPAELEKQAWELSEKNKVKPAFYGVKVGKHTYQHSINVSVNEEVLHAIPSSTRKIESGDIIKIDMGIIYQGLYTDQCFTFIVGSPKSQQDLNLVKIAKMATETAMNQAKVGNKTGDIGYAMETVANMAGYSVLHQYIGHGLGKSLHEAPEVPPYGQKGTGEKLKTGQVITVESQVMSGVPEVYVADDNWTVISKDKKPAAMFEYMVIVDSEPIILTPMQDWDIVVG